VANEAEPDVPQGLRELIDISEEGEPEFAEEQGVEVREPDAGNDPRLPACPRGHQPRTARQLRRRRSDRATAPHQRQLAPTAATREPLTSERLNQV